MLEQRIVHLPELSLRRGRFRSLCRVTCVRVSLREREIAEDEPQLFT